MITIHHNYYKREGSSFTTSELGGFESPVLSRTNSCKSCKINDLASGFRATPNVQKVPITKF